MPTKKTAAQLDRDIREVLAQNPGRDRALRRTTIRQQMERVRSGGRIQTVEIITEAPAAEVDARHAAAVAFASLPFFARKAAEAWLHAKTASTEGSDAAKWLRQAIAAVKKYSSRSPGDSDNHDYWHEFYNKEVYG